MREILFRGQREYGGEWVIGSLLSWPDGDTEILYPSPDHKDEMGKVLVHPETVGQFIGLTDKNGKKIFEGDIVAVKIGGLKRRGVVFYEDAATRFGLTIGAEKNFSFLGKQMAKMYEAEVIGNIHDNPELMEV